MKISNSKKQLAKIIHENGGWRDGIRAVYGAKTKRVCFLSEAAGYPEYNPTRKAWVVLVAGIEAEFSSEPFANWHQTILSRDEYFHLYPAQDADGWIEWKEGACPVDEGVLVDIRISSGEEMRGQRVHPRNWVKDGSFTDIISYRLHKPEIAPVAGVVPEPVVEAKPTIEHLAADYRNLKDYADRKQQEADAAKADADAKLAALVAAGCRWLPLVAAGEALGLVLSAATTEPKLVITDVKDLLAGDEVRCVNPNGGLVEPDSLGVVVGVSGDRFFTDFPEQRRYVYLSSHLKRGNVVFVRRPAKGDANA